MGAPNVRAANRVDEIEALNKRLETAEKNAETLGYRDVLDKLQRVVTTSSVAVICHSFSRFEELVSSDNKLFSTYYQEVEGEARIPEDNGWDAARVAADAILFPYYGKHLHFAALSIDGQGVAGYGDLCVTLRDAVIRDRASVFDENTILFVQKNGLVPGRPIPFGFRAPWNERGKLAAAKLGERLTSATDEKDFANILVSGNERTSDIIEVHIYGTLHRRAIQSCMSQPPKSKADRILLDDISRKLKEIGVIVETVK